MGKGLLGLLWREGLIRAELAGHAMPVSMHCARSPHVAQGDWIQL